MQLRFPSWQLRAKEYHKVAISIAAYSPATRRSFPSASLTVLLWQGRVFPVKLLHSDLEKWYSSVQVKVLQLCSTREIFPSESGTVLLGSTLLVLSALVEVVIAGLWGKCHVTQVTSLKRFTGKKESKRVVVSANSTGYRLLREWWSFLGWIWIGGFL